MRALLDINVLIALLDAAHVHHSLARRWFADHVEQGWASCPLTQNGCVRILSQPRYPNAVPVAAAAQRLDEALAHPSHAFWPDALSLFEPRLIDWTRLLLPAQLTDAYLLALAVHHDARLVSFDRAIPMAAVRGASGKHWVRL